MNWIHAHPVIAFLVFLVITCLLEKIVESYLMDRRLTLLLPPEFDTRNYRGVAIVERRKHGAFFER